MDYKKYIEDNTLRLDASRRGGGIEIDLGKLLDAPAYKMTAYQNYLGGGMLGKICNSYNFDLERIPPKQQEKVKAFTEILNRYFHAITNGEAEDWDAWSSASYEQNQARPVSAY